MPEIETRTQAKDFSPVLSKNVEIVSKKKMENLLSAPVAAATIANKKIELCTILFERGLSTISKSISDCTLVVRLNKLLFKVHSFRKRASNGGYDMQKYNT